MVAPSHNLHPLRTRPFHIVSYHGEAMVIADRCGWITGGSEGFYFRLTRFLSRLRLTVEGKAPRVVAANEINSYAAFAYYLAPSPAGERAGPEPESGRPSEVVESGTEVQVNRFVGGGFCDEVSVHNRALAAATVHLHWEIDADFADYSEASGGRRRQSASVDREWRGGPGGGELVLRYSHPKLPHAVSIRCIGPTQFSYAGTLGLVLELAPRQKACLRLEVTPVFCRKPVRLLYSAARGDVEPTAATRDFPLTLSTPNELLQSAWDRATEDLASLALLHGEGDEQRAPAGGIPKYDALFGRDILVTAFQAAFLDPAMLRGSLTRISRWNATSYDDRFDAEPGRVIHQRQQSPLALLRKNPFENYYGDYSAPGWFLIDLAWNYLLNGDKAFFLSLREKALATLEWMDRDGDRDGDGFYEYATRAGAQGEKNQGWKDSEEAILHDDGRLVYDPIALVEIQGCYYAAKRMLAETFRALGEDERAKRLSGEADQLKHRFNERFWMAEKNYYALALDPEKRPVRSIAPDVGQCLAYGIVADEHAAAVAARLMRPDLFTGWGIRTLSSEHPAFNPFSYHLGSVWPVANSIIASGLKRYGFIAELHRLVRAQLEASRLFELNRLPEVFGGHDRDASHPHPGIYPEATAPQAWSAGAVIELVMSLLGLVPAAPWGALILDPELPDWLPELTLTDLRVGAARVTLRFARGADGTTRHEVLSQEGALHVHRPPRRTAPGDRLPSLLDAVSRRG